MYSVRAPIFGERFRCDQPDVAPVITTVLPRGVLLVDHHLGSQEKMKLAHGEIMKVEAKIGRVTMARSATEIRSIRMAQILYLALFHEGQRSSPTKGDRCLAHCS